jgi:hypothetical protein
MTKPTIAEEHFARLIAFWHGSKVLYYKNGPVTVASSRGFDSGFFWEIERYAGRCWQEYVPAARAIIESRNASTI